MSLQLATRILHIKDGNSYDTIDILRGAKGESPDIDDALSDVSENPVQNKVIKGALDDKVDVESGKGLSTNDFTTTLKDKLTKTNVTYCTCATTGSTATKVVSIASGANTTFNFYVGAIVAVKFTYSNTAQNPKLNVNNTGAKPVRANGSQITTTYLSYAGYANRTILYMYNGVEWTFLGWDTDSTATYSDATQSQHGLMSAADKTKLDGIETGANKTVVDNALDGESTNPVQNAVVTEALDGKADIGDLAPAYSTSGTYEVGDYVTYTGNVYRCTTAITTAEAWTAAHWTQVAIGDELSSTKADLSELSSSIAPVESSATATAAHAVGELFMMGETLMVALSAIAIGDTITTEGGSPNAAVTTLSSKLLKDVQVNGTSVVNQGVAEIPLMDAYSKFGIPKVAAGRGLSISASQKTLYVDFATTDQIKVGTVANMALQAAKQHESSFYGLAKAAGSDEKNSSLAVGTYTDAAKIAIQKMLGIYEAPWELIRDDTFTNETEATIEITVDDNGQPFELTDIRIMVMLPTQNTQSSIGGYGRVRFYDGSDLVLLYIGSYTQAAGATPRGAFGWAEYRNGMTEVGFSRMNESGNYSYNQFVNQFNKTSQSFPWQTKKFLFDKITIESVTGSCKCIVYGKRAWS